MDDQNTTLQLGSHQAMKFIALGKDIWSRKIHHPKFTAIAFPPTANIQC